MAIVGNVMSRPVVTIAPDNSVADALAIASEHGVDYLPVVDGDTLEGLVCVQDLDDERLDADVGGVMRAPAVTVPVGASLARALEQMDRHATGCVLAISGGLLAGVLTRGDLIRAGLPEEDVIGGRRCSACGSFRHVRQTPRSGLFLCSECLGRTDVRGREDELGVGD